jgi:hypothetical protein
MALGEVANDRAKTFKARLHMLAGRDENAARIGASRHNLTRAQMLTKPMQMIGEPDQGQHRIT